MPLDSLRLTPEVFEKCHYALGMLTGEQIDASMEAAPDAVVAFNTAAFIPVPASTPRVGLTFGMN